MALGSARGGRQSCYFLIWSREGKAGLCPPLPLFNGMMCHSVRAWWQTRSGMKGWDVSCGVRNQMQEGTLTNRENGPEYQRSNAASSTLCGGGGKAGRRRRLCRSLTCARPSSDSAFLPRRTDDLGSDVNDSPLPAGVSHSCVFFIASLH